MDNDDLLLTHAALVALTPLVPLPLVDELARRSLRRRLLRQLAERHGRTLSETDVEVLSASTDSLVDGKAIGRRLLLMPVKWVFRRVLLALRGKAIIDAASLALHRGALWDGALRDRLVETYGPDRVRAAIEALLREAPVAGSPVTTALRTGISASQEAFARSFTVLREELREGSIDQTLERAGQALREAGGLRALRRALSPQPRAHLERLQARLRERLVE